MESRFACLIAPWPSHGLVVLSHYSLLLCHPALHCVAWFEKIQHFSEFLGRWSSSLRAQQMVVGRRCHPC